MILVDTDDLSSRNKSQFQVSGPNCPFWLDISPFWIFAASNTWKHSRLLFFDARTNLSAHYGRYYLEFFTRNFTISNQSLSQSIFHKTHTYQRVQETLAPEISRDFKFQVQISHFDSKFHHFGSLHWPIFYKTLLNIIFDATANLSSQFFLAQ